MSTNTKRVTIKLNPVDHKKFKVQSAKEGLYLNDKVENLIEDYVFGAVKLESDKFKMKQKNVDLTKEIYENIIKRMEEDSCKKRLNYSKTKLAKGLIDKYILSKNSLNFKKMNRKMIAFYQDNYDRKDPMKIRTVSFNVNEKMSNEIDTKINNRRDPKRLNNFKKKMEILFYAYAENKIELDNIYFKKKHLSIRLDKELHKKFKDSLKRYGSKLTMQKVGECLIKKELERS
jgi:hypothetical protein